MQFITRVPPKIALALATLLYTAIGFFVVTWFDREIATGEALMLVALCYPIFLIITVWNGVEIYTGRRIIQRYTPDPEMRTKAQRQAERKASAVTLAFAAFVSLAPIGVALYNDTVFSLTTFAPLFVWSWLLYAFGINRLRYGVIVMTSKQNKDDLSPKTDVRRFRDFNTGLILSRAEDPSGEWFVNYDKRLKDGVPHIFVKLTNQANGEHLRTDPSEILALIGVLTGDGNPYRLIFALNLSQNVDLDAMTAHERIEAAGYYSSAMARLPELRAA